MADQATLNSDRQQAPASGMRRNMAGFAADLAELAELQLHLFLSDGQTVRQGIALPVAAMAGGLVIAMGCIPVGLATLAFILMAVTELSMTIAFTFAFSSGIAAAGILLCFGWVQFRKKLSGFERSGFEAKRNYKWLKDTLRQTK